MLEGIKLSPAQDGLAEISPDQQRFPEVCAAEIRAVQKRPGQVHPAQVCSSEVHTGEIGLDRVMLLPPLVPDISSLV